MSMPYGLPANGGTNTGGADTAGTGGGAARGTGGGPRGPGLPAAPRVWDQDWTAATRYMCAGAHLDDGFAKTVVHELRYERFRACAPSYGVDLSLVRGHAERAQKALVRRDAAVAVTFLVAFVLLPVPTLAYWFAQVFMENRDPGRSFLSPGRQAVGGRVVPGRRDPALKSLVVSALVQLAVLGTVCFLDVMVSLPVTWLATDFWVAWILAAFLLLCCPWYFTWEQRRGAWKVISDELTLAAFAASGARRPDPASTGLPQSAVGGEGNLIVYSGYRPFVGAGDEVSSWSFATRLTPEGWEPTTGQEPPPVPFDASAMVRSMIDGLDRLRSATAASVDGIAGLDVTEKVFVHGSELKQNPLLSPRDFWPGHVGQDVAESRPTDMLGQRQVETVRGLIDGPVRHCLCVQVRSWGTDLVLSVFVQVAVSGATLYLQADTLVLPPVKEAYRVADSIARPELTDDPVRGAADALRHSRPVMTSAPFNALSDAFAPRRRRRAEEEQRWAIQHDRRYDFGARISLRELAASHQYRNFFQLVDVSRVSKQIELQVLGTLAAFLHDQGLDISDLDERRKTILNNGILMTGGSMSGVIAAGTGASAVSGTGDKGGAKAAGGGKGSDG